MDAANDETWTDWTMREAAGLIRIPRPDDDKYSRGVLGVVTGSADFPGAAVLGVEAAARTGVGMIRYRGPGRATRLVLQRRPEVVTVTGRVQAWLLGSGVDAATRAAETTSAFESALSEKLPTVLDAGALDLVAHPDASSGRVVITPHAGELATLWTRAGTELSRSDVVADAKGWATRTAERFGVTVLLKGYSTLLCSPSGERHVVTATSSWAATAGSGDVLGGVLGALLASHSAAGDSAAGDSAARDSAAGDSAPGERGAPTLAEVAAAAAFVHQAAGEHASDGGPVTALDIAEAVPAVIRSLVAAVRPRL